MTTAAHTPGPWRVGLDKNSVRDSDEGYIADCQNRFADKTTVEANARLIAASPSLYDFVKSKADHGDADAAQLIASI